MTSRLLAKWLVALGLVVAPLWAAPAQGAVAFVQSCVDITDPFVTDGIGECTLGANSTIGNLMIVAFDVQTGSRTVTTVTAGGATLSLCNQGGTNATQETADSFEMWMYCGVATSATTACSVTLSSAVSISGKVICTEFSGQHATLGTAIEDIAIATNSGIGDHDTGNVVTASAGSALVGYLIGGSGTYTIDADFTEFTGSGDGFGRSGYDLVDAGTFSFNTTSAGNENTGQIVIAIAPAAGGGGGGTGHIRLPMSGVGAALRVTPPTVAALERLNIPVEQSRRRPRYRGRR